MLKSTILSHKQDNSTLIILTQSRGLLVATLVWCNLRKIWCNFAKKWRRKESGRVSASGTWGKNRVVVRVAYIVSGFSEMTNTSRLKWWFNLAKPRSSGARMVSGQEQKFLEIIFFFPTSPSTTYFEVSWENSTSTKKDDYVPTGSEFEKWVVSGHWMDTSWTWKFLNMILSTHWMWIDNFLKFQKYLWNSWNPNYTLTSTELGLKALETS